MCSQIGNVNTGAADPVLEIATLTHERGAWLHVDGASACGLRPARRCITSLPESNGRTPWRPTATSG